jgi:hypothetical protein
MRRNPELPNHRYPSDRFRDRLLMGHLGHAHLGFVHAPHLPGHHRAGRHLVLLPRERIVGRDGLHPGVGAPPEAHRTHRFRLLALAGVGILVAGDALLETARESDTLQVGGYTIVAAPPAEERAAFLADTMKVLGTGIAFTGARTIASESFDDGPGAFRVWDSAEFAASTVAGRYRMTSRTSGWDVLSVRPIQANVNVRVAATGFLAADAARGTSVAVTAQSGGRHYSFAVFNSGEARLWRADASGSLLLGYSPGTVGVTGPIRLQLTAVNGPDGVYVEGRRGDAWAMDGFDAKASALFTSVGFATETDTPNQVVEFDDFTAATSESVSRPLWLDLVRTYIARSADGSIGFVCVAENGLNLTSGEMNAVVNRAFGGATHDETAPDAGEPPRSPDRPLPVSQVGTVMTYVAHVVPGHVILTSSTSAGMAVSLAKAVGRVVQGESSGGGRVSTAADTRPQAIRWVARAAVPVVSLRMSDQGS